MPSERHIMRQVEWKNTLSKYGVNVNLERTIKIKGAKVVVDVYVQVENKIFLIEIGNIEDERKTALMRYYAEQNPNIEFIHEAYGFNGMQLVLEQVNAYRNSTEYKQIMRERKERLKRIKEWENEKKERRGKQKEIEEKAKIAIAILFFSFIIFLVTLLTEELVFIIPSLAFFLFAVMYLPYLAFQNPRKSPQEVIEDLKSRIGKIDSYESLRAILGAILEDDLDLIEIQDKGSEWHLKPKMYLGADNFVKIAEIVRQYNGTYVSKGKNSHFRIPKE